jgi:hypothetical protein
MRLPPSVYTFLGHGITSAADLDIRYTAENCDAPGISAKGTPGYASPGLYGRIAWAMRISAGGGKVSQKGRREADRPLGPGGGFRDDCVEWRRPAPPYKKSGISR